MSGASHHSAGGGSGSGIGGGSTSTGGSGGPAPDSLSPLARTSAAATCQSASLRGPPTTQGMVAIPSASGSPPSSMPMAPWAQASWAAAPSLPNAAQQQPHQFPSLPLPSSSGGDTQLHSALLTATGMQQAATTATIAPLIPHQAAAAAAAAMGVLPQALQQAYPGGPAPPPAPGVMPQESVAPPSWTPRDPCAKIVAISRDAIFRGIGLLASNQRLDRGRTESFLALLHFLSRAQGRDCSVGVAGLLSHLLQNEPKAFTDARKRKALGTEESQQVFQRLTAGDTSCHVIATVAPAGGDAVVCSARMAEIFLCPQELSRLLHMTGVVSFFFWPMFLCRGQALDDLYTGMVSLIMEPFPRPQVDVFVECRTRQGHQVRCLASVATQLVMPSCTGSFIVLRLLTLG